MNPWTIALCVGGFFYLLEQQKTPTTGSASTSSNSIIAALQKKLADAQKAAQQKSSSSSGGSGNKGGGDLGATSSPGGSSLSSFIKSIAPNQYVDTYNPVFNFGDIETDESAGALPTFDYSSQFNQYIDDQNSINAGLLDDYYSGLIGDGGFGGGGNDFDDYGYDDQLFSEWES